MWTYYLKGLMLCAGLIVAIGAQNAYVLRQGLLKQHVALVVAFCCVCDMLLIGAGVWGLGKLAAWSPWLLQAVTWGGALFLFAYGLLAAKRAWQGGGHLVLDTEHTRPQPAGKVLATVAAMTLLNPHVYLDTVMLIGGVAAGFAATEKWAFWLGAASMSVLWFCGLGFGARLLQPLFRREGVWRLLDTLIALMMAYLGIGLLRSVW
ncbi:MAG: LysE/ArgO family amino acid transporter [Eikenella sp.]|nr:LysE/ArgO family amino acid transporter [Eikenella sp.]